MGLQGNYSIRMFCDHPQHLTWGPSGHCDGAVYKGGTQGDCVVLAKAAGWRIDWRRYDARYGRGHATCPVCAKIAKEPPV